VAQTSTEIELFYPVSIVRYEFDTAALAAKAGEVMLEQLAGASPKRPLVVPGRIRS
jgi:hypothetical protein